VKVENMSLGTVLVIKTLNLKICAYIEHKLFYYAEEFIKKVGTILVSCVTNQDDFKIPVFSTKTPYFWGKDIDESIQEDEGTWIDFEDKECQIVHLNLILRHGSRFLCSLFICYTIKNVFKVTIK
jgi:hypothetical protein